MPPFAGRAWPLVAALVLTAGMFGVLSGAVASRGQVSDAEGSVHTTELAAGSAGSDAPAAGVTWHGLWSDWSDTEREQALDRVVDAGLEWVRLDVGWSTLQPEGPESWAAWYDSEIERVLDMAAARDLRVLVMVWRTPDWATSGHRVVDPPDEPDDYARAVQWLAERFGDRVDAWQVWNEPNLASFWSTEDAEQYAELLAATAPRVRAADPGTPVVLGGVSTNDRDWLAELYAAGAAGDFDVLAVHPYPQPADDPPDLPDDGTPVRTRHVEAVRELMVDRGDADVPIWLTEIGWSAHDNSHDPDPWRRGVSAQTQADHSVALLDMVAQDHPFVENVFFYNLRNRDTGDPHRDNFGLLTRDLRPKPVYDAVAGRLADGGAEQRQADGGDEAGGENAAEEDADAIRLERINGEDRIGTAATAARTGWDRVDTVVIARADDPVDALAGAALAGAEQAPLLVTWPGGLHPVAAAVLQDLGVEEALLLGGTAALSPQVAEDLHAHGVDTERLAGAHRSQTAARISARTGGDTVVLVGGAEDARNWPDALAASAWTAWRNAHGRATAVLLAGQSVPPATRAALDALEPSEIVVVGGPSVVPDGAVDSVRGDGRVVSRVAGADRFATSRAVAQRHAAEGPDSDTLVVVTGDDFADALTAGPYAAKQGAGMVLVPSEPEAVQPDWWRERADLIGRLVAVGGNRALPFEVTAELGSLLSSGS